MEGRDVVALSREHRLSGYPLQSGNGLPGVTVIYILEFLMGSGQQGLGEHFQPFPNLYDVCNQISKEDYLTATSLSWE